MAMKTDQEFTESGLQNAVESHEEGNIQKKSMKSESTELKAFLAVFHEEKDCEEKIRKAIDFMRSRLSLTTSPKFREFWEARALCLPLFKETLSAKSRTELWQQYVDLSVEARRLKEILDEQSAFAFEQIDLAVQSLVSDLDSCATATAHMAEIEGLAEARSLNARRKEYNQTQKELHFLNALAAKVNALRKEVIKTDMRIRSKNKLFDKLSECGDRIFPRRKELIKKISEEFVEDVARFIDKNFVKDQEPSAPLHVLRAEIKALQSIAKILTLNTHAFTETRLQLSRCWDLIRDWDKEKKKEVEEKKVVYQQNLDEFLVEVQEFEALCAQEESFSVVESKFQELLQAIRGKELGRVEHKIIRDRMDGAKKPHEDKRQEEIRAVLEKEKQEEEMRTQKVQNLRNSVQSLIDNAFSISFEEFSLQKVALEEEHKALNLSKAEKALQDRLFKNLKDKMLEAKGRSLLSLSDDEQNQYAGLKQLLEEKKERRQEMKHQLELYRKALGGSSLDFEKAMACQEMMEAEKESLEHINAIIEEIEEKMAQIEG